MLRNYIILLAIIFPTIAAADILSGIIASFLSYLYTKITDSKYK